MILIYLDESGDTGTNLRDPQQPIFVLGAMLIPEKEWKTIETEYWNLITEIYDKKIPNDFELHAIDLVNRKGSFSMFSLEEAKNIRNKILQFIKDFEVNIFYRKIEKKKYQLYCEKQFGVGIKIDPYIMAFPYISWKVEETLSQNNEMGIFIFDEHRSVLDIEQSIK